MSADATTTELTIDELAQQLGMTARNIREYQALGLLPPPRKRGRTGYYGPDHVARAGRIRELKADGFPLDLIRRVLDESVREPFQDEVPEVVEQADFERRFGAADPATIDSAVELGLLRRLPGGRYELPSPRLARVGDAMRDLGLGLADFVALTRAIRPLQEQVAELFIDVYRERVWGPFEQAGAPPDAVAGILAQLEHLRPLALDTVLVQFKMAMDAVVERTIEGEAP
jgi:DNA-binding transcriptional MerR regulator